MARTRRIRRDGDAHYHLMSRTNDRRFLFSKGRVKGEIVSLLRKAAAFSGVRLEAWCVMDNHFHIVCGVVRPDAPVPEAEVVRRIGVLGGERFAAELAEHWSDLRSCGLDSVVGQPRVRPHGRKTVDKFGFAKRRRRFLVTTAVFASRVLIAMPIFGRERPVASDDLWYNTVGFKK